MPLNGQHRAALHPIASAFVACLTIASSGCIDSTGGAGPVPDLIWGVQGIEPGQLQKPRAIAIDSSDQIYLVDMTARIQVYDADGKYLRGWKTPVCVNGRPTGLSIAKNGHVWVPDTHYYRMLAYDRDGVPVEAENLGGVMGPGPGEFAWVTDVVEDSEGSIYVSEYGDTDRIQKFSRDGKFLLQWAAPAKNQDSFAAPKAWPSIKMTTFGSPTPAITASKSSTRRANSSSTGAKKAPPPASSTIRTVWRSTIMVAFTFASTATTACRSSTSTANH